MDVRDEQSGIHTVVGMEGFASGQSTTRAHSPMLVDFHVDTPLGPQSLCNGELLPLYPPCPQVFSCGRDCDVVSKPSLYSRIGAGGVVLVNRGTKKKVASAIPGQERGFAPRSPDSELNCSREITRMQILLSKWPGFPNHVPRKR